MLEMAAQSSFSTYSLFLYLASAEKPVLQRSEVGKAKKSHSDPWILIQGLVILHCDFYQTDS